MATFQIDSIFLDDIKALIKKKDNTLLKRKLQPVHYADLGEIIEGLSIEEATYLIKLLRLVYNLSCRHTTDIIFNPSSGLRSILFERN
jgi:Mg/Co/Ni transporter MgtE